MSVVQTISVLKYARARTGTAVGIYNTLVAGDVIK